MDKPKKETEPEIKLTEQELKTLSTLLFTGKWGLSMRESQQIIAPLINKIAKIIDLIYRQKGKRVRGG